METFERTLEPPVKPAANGTTGDLATAVLEELDRILKSPQFRHCTRGKQFLNYVVREELEGRSENLKERSIGVAVFRRAATYATGDDPVVRVQAGEVRRRLDQYYRGCPDQPALRIELPVGSYVPEFRREAPAATKTSRPNQPEEPRSASRASSASSASGGSANWWRIGFFVLAVVLVVASAIAAWVQISRSRMASGQMGPLAQSIGADTALAKFWAPALNSSQPAMIYLAKGVTYRPSPAVYRKYARTHHGAFAMQVQRANQPLPLNPNTKLKWKQMVLYTDYGVAAGDVYAAVRLSTLFGKIGKPDQLRIGANFSYADLSSSPTVLVGGFNDKWTMLLTSKLHFAFVDKGSAHMSIHEQIPHGRTWPWQQVSETHRDYALVTRLRNSDTGQFTVVAAGCSGAGTEAAGDFVTSEKSLAAGVKGLPKNWQNENLQLVLETHVVDGVPQPAKVIASYTW